jgi:hypothetical protein
MEKCCYCGSSAQVRVTIEEKDGKLCKTITCGCGTTEIIEYTQKTVRIIDKYGIERKF